MLTGKVEYMVESMLENCYLVGELNGAMWPNHLLPRGNPSLVLCFKKVVESTGVEPMTFGHGGTFWIGSGY